MRALLLTFFALMVLQAPSAVAEQKASLFTGIVVKSARGIDGVEVVEVRPGSFSDSAGLKKGDVIIELDGAEIDSLGSFVEHSKAVERKDDVIMVVSRSGNNVDVAIFRDPSLAGRKKGDVGGAVESVEGAAGSAVGYAEETAHKAVKGAEEAAGDAYKYAGEAAHKGVKVTGEAASGAYGYAKEGARDVKEAARDAVKFTEKETHKAVKSAEDVTTETLEADEGMPKETQKPEDKN